MVSGDGPVIPVKTIRPCRLVSCIGKSGRSTSIVTGLEYKTCPPFVPPVAVRSYFRSATVSGILIESWAGRELAVDVPPRGLRTKTVTTDALLTATTVIETDCPGATTAPSAGEVI